MNTISDLCEGKAACFLKFCKEVIKLEFTSQPNYGKLCIILQNLIQGENKEMASDEEKGINEPKSTTTFSLKSLK